MRQIMCVKVMGPVQQNGIKICNFKTKMHYIHGGFYIIQIPGTGTLIIICLTDSCHEGPDQPQIFWNNREYCVVSRRCRPRH